MYVLVINVINEDEERYNIYHITSASCLQCTNKNAPTKVAERK